MIEPFKIRETPQHITVVSGRGRCGTTAMMRMLWKGGMDVGEATEPLLEFGHGDNIKDWIANYRGKVFKRFTLHQHRLPLCEEYRVLWMQRDPKEQIKSWVKTEMRQHPEMPLPGRKQRREWENILKTATKKSIAWLQRNGIMYVRVQYEDVLNYPLEMSKGIAAFIGHDLDVKEMAAVVHKRSAKCRKDFYEDQVWHEVETGKRSWNTSY